MNRKLVPNLIVAALIIAGGIIYFKYDTGKKDKIIEDLKSEYPAIGLGEEINATVTYIHPTDLTKFRNDPYSARVVFDDSIKRRFSTTSELSKDVSLEHVLNVGDRIIKAGNDDKIFIYRIQQRDTLKFAFELLDDFRYPIKKKR
jgi:hypothetical protein